MTLPNAHKGVKKLFIAEILQLIAVALVLFGVVFFGAALNSVLNASEAEASAFVTGGAVALAGGLVLPILAYVLSLVGLKQASKDEPDRMAKAFTSAITALILSVLSVIALYFGWWELAIFLDFLQTIADICVFVFTIMGVSEVTQNISRQDVADMGPKVLTLVVIAAALSFIASLFESSFGDVASIISACIMLVAYFVYLVFLGRATSALAKG